MSLAFGFALPHWQAISGGFSPASLFAGGTAGAWYDPSDLTTMFTTSAGTTPVAMPGLGSAVSVGLMLDKSQGLVLGSELLADPGFDNAASWETNAGVTIAGGEAVWNTAGTSVYVRQPNITTSYGYYEFTIVCSSYTSGSVLVAIGAGASTQTSFPINQAGVVRFRLNVTTFSGRVWLITPVGGAQLSITSFSVRQVSGNHAIAFNDTTARPELRARVNLLTYSEEFDNGVWVKAAASVGINAAAAPDGTLTADALIEDATNARHATYQSASLSLVTPFVASVYVKANTRTYALFGVGNSRFTRCIVNLSTGVAGALIGSEAANLIATVSSVGNGWWRVVIAGAFSTADSGFLWVGASDGSEIYTGDGTSGIYIWGADLRPTNIGANVPAYQRIADANTYDTSGFPLYLFFDGIDDSMYTPASIPFATVTSDGQARRNLLLNPTQFDAAAWTTTNLTVTANTAAAPDGTTTADTLDDASASFGSLSQIVSSLANSAYNFSVYIKSSGVASDVRIDLYTTVGEQFFAIFNSGTGAYVSGNGVIYTTTSVGNGWYRVSLSASGSGNTTVRVYPAGGSAGATGSIFLWGAQLETGSTATAFQNIGTDKMSVFAGVRKLSDAARGIVVELSSTYANTGTFAIGAPHSTAASTYEFAANGTPSSGGGAYVPSGYAAPISNVLAMSVNLAGANLTQQIIPRIDGTVTQTGGASSASGGNFGTYPLFVGARNNATARFNGHLHSLIIAGSAVSAGNISATEQWVAGKTGLALP